MTTETEYRALLEQALEALDNSVDVVCDEYADAVRRYANIPSRKTKLDRLAAMARAHLDASDAIRAELAKPVEASYTATQLAAMVLSDCGISTDHTALHERVAARITRHEDELIDRLKNQAKSPTPAWHDAPTCNGRWFNTVSGRIEYVVAGTIDAWKGSCARWYGPISQDTESKP